jgi:general L-amino acid transport system permease protein
MEPQQTIENRLPPITPNDPVQWVRANLFSSWFNSILTILSLLLIYKVATSAWLWATGTAQWEVLNVNLYQFFIGRYPLNQTWRLWGVTTLLSLLSGLSWGIWGRFSRGVAIFVGAVPIALLALLPIALMDKVWILAIAATVFASFFAGQKLKPVVGNWLFAIWLLSFPLLIWLIGGGIGLAVVPDNLWNGLLLTVLMAVAGILLSFPLGVLLALGRQSTMPIFRWFSVIYIEVMRGLPLIGILFMAQVMFPLLLPPGVEISRVIRAIMGFVLFSAAYLAENVRGGLQSIPRGQIEAAKALGLNVVQTVLLIVLPQALRAVIPAIVGQFIGLFKDTSLVAIVGLVDLMGVCRTILAQPDYIGRYAEVYLFAALIYWIFCYSMSLGSRKLEKSLASGY